MRLWNEVDAGNLKLTNENGLSPVHLRAIELLLEGSKPLKDIAEELSLTADAFREMRRKPEFVKEYRHRLQLHELESLDFGISRRRERISALNDQWLKLKAEMAKRHVPRSDQIYALIALQKAAAAEMGQDVQRVQIGGNLEITEAIRVIRFEAIEGGKSPEADSEVVDAEYRDVEASAEGAEDITPQARKGTPGRYGPAPAMSPLPEPPPSAVDPFERAVDINWHPKRLDPEYVERLRAVIAESGLDPHSVLVPEQLKAIYGEVEE